VHAERLIERTEQRRALISAEPDARHRARWGQFFTPLPVADFLAGLIDIPDKGEFRILDPGAGVGTLSAALVARAITTASGCAMRLVAYEADPLLAPALRATLRDCERTAGASGLTLTTELRCEDFLSGVAERSHRLHAPEGESFDACIMNPPYRKISTSSSERAAMDGIGLRVTNLYTAFLGAATVVLAPSGQLSAITPRSFANGPYHLPFRRFFLDRMRLDRVHVYERRGELFADADVLQENVIVRAIRGEHPDTVLLSKSGGRGCEPVARRVPAAHVIHPNDPMLFIRIPVDEEATAVAERVARLPVLIGDLDLQVSTGRVVDFRTRENLRDHYSQACAPLVYPGHLAAGRVRWPHGASRKPSALALHEGTRPLVLPNGSYTLVKRFSAKEERRRVVASCVRSADLPGESVAFENHLNVFHRRNAGIEPALAAGLTVFLNTSTVDDYVRQFSGHTQINATDLRLLRYPDRNSLLRMGALVETRGWPVTQAAVDAIAHACIVGFAGDADSEVAA
jgi:adenine-specific DNA-methyltransferase